MYVDVLAKNIRMEQRFVNWLPVSPFIAMCKISGVDEHRCNCFEVYLLTFVVRYLCWLICIKHLMMSHFTSPFFNDKKYRLYSWIEVKSWVPMHTRHMTNGFCHAHTAQWPRKKVSIFAMGPFTRVRWLRSKSCASPNHWCRALFVQPSICCHWKVEGCGRMCGRLHFHNDARLAWPSQNWHESSWCAPSLEGKSQRIS